MRADGILYGSNNRVMCCNKENLVTCKIINDGGLWCYYIQKEELKKIMDETPIEVKLNGVWIYYISEKKSLHRIRINGASQSKIESNVDNFEVTDSYIFYIKDHLLFRCNKDGSNKIQLINENCKCVTTNDSSVFYINISFKVCRIDYSGKNKKVISKADALQIHLMDNNIYFIGGSVWVKNANYIYKVSIDGDNETKLLDDRASEICCYNKRIYYINNSYNNYIFSVDINGKDRTQQTDEAAMLINISGYQMYYQKIFEENGMVFVNLLETKPDVKKTKMETYFGGNALEVKSLLEANYILKEIGGIEELYTDRVYSLINKIFMKPDYPHTIYDYVSSFICEEFNTKYTNKAQLKEICRYKESEKSKAIMFVDSSLFGNRKKGFIVATDGIYLKHGGVVKFNGFGKGCQEYEFIYDGLWFKLNSNNVGKCNISKGQATYIIEIVDIIYAYFMLRIH